MWDFNSILAQWKQAACDSQALNIQTKEKPLTENLQNDCDLEKNQEKEVSA